VKAAILNKPAAIENDPLQFTDIEEPKVGKVEVLVRIAATGVCRSNLHMIEAIGLKAGYRRSYRLFLVMRWLE
jgi:D-arabinose 1-dehydrogenase-like Zn-dependent alcohol dehydrogenase